MWTRTNAIIQGTGFWHMLSPQYLCLSFHSKLSCFLPLRMFGKFRQVKFFLYVCLSYHLNHCGCFLFLILGMSQLYKRSFITLCKLILMSFTFFRLSVAVDRGCRVELEFSSPIALLWLPRCAPWACKWQTSAGRWMCVVLKIMNVSGKEHRV